MATKHDMEKMAKERPDMGVHFYEKTNTQKYPLFKAHLFLTSKEYYATYYTSTLPPDTIILNGMTSINKAIRQAGKNPKTNTIFNFLVK